MSWFCPTFCNTDGVEIGQVAEVIEEIDFTAFYSLRSSAFSDAVMIILISKCF
jgi:hypothetical protein